MKYLIYQLFSGVGFCNQLFSLETGVYLSSILNRRLILIIKYPLCHCGSSSWNYGNIMDFISDEYLKYLPNGIDIYYKNSNSDELKVIIDSKECDYIEFPNRFSQIGIVDKDLYNNNNKDQINKFLNNRLLYLNDMYNNKSKYIYINQSNASRCFCNFYTTRKNYIIMSNICKSLSKLDNRFYQVYNNLLDIPKNYFSLHFRFGDNRHSKEIIDANSLKYKNLLIKKISNLNRDKLPIVLMCDRNDASLLKDLQENYTITYTDNIIKNKENIIKYMSIFPNFKNYEVIKFLLEKIIIEDSNIFIGYDGSTVSHHINYMNYINNKPYFHYLDKDIKYKENNYSWVLNGNFGANVSWRVFFSDNIYMENFKLITLTNDGYMYLTENLLESMKKINLEKSLKIYCIGNKSYQYFKDKYPSNEIEEIEIEGNYLKDWIEYKGQQNTDLIGKKMWATLTSYKLYVINNELIKGNDIIFTDGDIVFEKNPLEYMKDNIKHYDILVQNDHQQNDQPNMCTGFFYMKSNEITKKITNFKDITNNINSFPNDQQYLRRMSSKLKVKYLNLEEFPNGKYFRDRKPKEPYIIHFNYDVSKDKIRRMRMFNKWYLGNDFDIIKPKIGSINNTNTVKIANIN